MTEDEIILTHVLQCSRSDLHLKKPQISLQQQARMDEIKNRRAHGEPLQYILGECEFFGFPFKVDQRVLIPRPETELLVETVLEHLATIDAVQGDIYVLDIGTGSGNIPVSIAKHNPKLKIVSIDVSKDALDLAKENASLNRVPSRINFIEADVFKWLGGDNPYQQRFSVIVSNPPYVKSADMAGLPPDVRKEPAQALDGGNDGLKFYEHIIRNAFHVLKPGGWVFFEIADLQGKSLENLLTGQGSFVNIQTSQDYNQRDRIVKAQLIV